MVSDQTQDRRKILVLTELVASSDNRAEIIAKVTTFDGKSQFIPARVEDLNVDFNLINGVLRPVFTKAVVYLKYFLPDVKKDKFVLKGPENQFGLYEGHVVKEVYAKDNLYKSLPFS